MAESDTRVWFLVPCHEPNWEWYCEGDCQRDIKKPLVDDPFIWIIDDWPNTSPPPKIAEVLCDECYHKRQVLDPAG